MGCSSGYDIDQNGKADFYSLRNMVQSYFSPLSIQKVKGNNQAHLVFYVHYQSDNFYYIVLKQPLFYAVDVNEDGHWDLMYKDPLMDGINGNESYYESPSGMFAHCPESCP